VRRGSDSVETVVWLGHLLLAVALGPLLTLSRGLLVPEAVWYGVAALYLAAPLLGYAWSMRGLRGEVPSDGPCERTGTVLGWHWFEFPGQGGDRWWTRDGALADQIRARRAPLPQRGLEVELRPGPSSRRALQLDRMLKNLIVVSTTMVTGFFTFVVWMAVSEGGLAEGGPESGLGGLVLTSMACAPFSLLPALLGLWIGYWSAFVGGLGLWRKVVVPARTASIRWTGPQLHTERGTVYVDEPGTTVALAHDLFGTALTVDDGQQRLVLRGTHALLAPLADALEARRAAQEPTDEAARRAGAWTRAVRARSLEP
jgi:hypothetical protein